MVDTLELPFSAKALTPLTQGRIAFLTGEGDRLVIFSPPGSVVDSISLPERVVFAQRILLNEDLFYVISGSELILYDLKTGKKGVIAKDIDDAVLTSIGEIWTLSDFSLKRLSPLGRQLESINLTRRPLRLECFDDSLIPLFPGERVKADWSDELEKSNQESLIYSTSQYLIAMTKDALYILADSKRVLMIR